MCMDFWRFERIEIVHTTSDGIGIELFSYPNGVNEAPEFNPFNTELFSRADVAKTLVEVLDDDVRKNQIFEILSGETPIEKAVRS